MSAPSGEPSAYSPFKGQLSSAELIARLVISFLKDKISPSLSTDLTLFIRNGTLTTIRTQTDVRLNDLRPDK